MNLMAGKVLNPGQSVGGCHLPEPGPVLCLLLAPGRDTQQISLQFLNEHTLLQDHPRPATCREVEVGSGQNKGSHPIPRLQGHPIVDIKL